MLKTRWEKIYKPSGENTKMSTKAYEDIGLQVNAKKTKQAYMITSRQQNVIQNQNITIGNLTENFKFKYQGVTVTNTKNILAKIKRTINLGNLRYI